VFEKIITDDPQFPHEFLPKDKLYRPDIYQRNRIAPLIIAIAIVLAYFSLKRWLGPLTPLETGLLLLSTILLLFIVQYLAAIRKARALSALNIGLGLEANGEIQKAIECLNDACRKTRTIRPYHALLLHERALLEVRHGNLKLALGMFGATHLAGAGAQVAPIYKALTIARIAYCFALLGDIPRSELWQAYAREHIQEGWQGVLAPCELLIGLRTGRAERAITDLETDWPAIVGVLRGKALRELQMLCAYALAQTPENETRDTGVQRWISTLEPRKAGEFSKLAENLPELKPFLEKHGL
jgi:tetratricopeptide (TPR) repeat protein